jgi:hypothetical protein
MAAVMDDDEVMGRQRGQTEDECNNQIVLDCVRGEWAMNNNEWGQWGGGQHDKRGRWMTQDKQVPDNVEQSGGKQCKVIQWWMTRQEEGGGGRCG